MDDLPLGAMTRSSGYIWRKGIDGVGDDTNPPKLNGTVTGFTEAADGIIVLITRSSTVGG